MSLFDADEYTAPGRTPRKPRRATKPKDPPPHTVEVVVNRHWTYVHRTTPGVVHCGSHTDKQRLDGPTVTYCGLIGTPLTFAVGDRVHGCGVCVDRGAPIGQPVAS